MKGYNKWSYTPYKPLLFNTGDVYICRIVPSKNAIHFEWFEKDLGKVQIFCKKREDETFVLQGETCENSFDIVGLEEGFDYEFYVAIGDKKSRVRLARTGESVGTIVNYLHPDDKAYSFSGKFLCSPSFIRHPDGYLLSSMDLYEGGAPQNLTLVFRSDDDGETWHYVCELMPCFWGKLFLHKGDVYMLGVSTEYGDLLISKSEDGGNSFPAPVCLLRGANGKNGQSGVHKNPQNVLVHNNRLYTTIEWGTWANKEYCHAAMVISCSTDDDLLNPENWHFTQPRPFDRFTDEFKDCDLCMMTIEGTTVLSPDNKLLDVMRFGVINKALAYEINQDDPDAQLTFSHTIPFPANFSKFMIKYDEISKKYYSVATRIYDENKPVARNLLSLMVSPDLYNWEVATDLMDYRNCDEKKVGFQYVDFEFDGDDLIFVCRTALNGADTFHNTNYQTFHRIKDFRKI